MGPNMNHTRLVYECTVTVEASVDLPTARRFYRLYVETFGELATKAVARQVLHEDEFMEEMRDPRVHKYVAWDDTGEAIAMATLTNHLETVPWISPEYFAHHYPEHTARGAVYYLGFILVAPGRRRGHLAGQILSRLCALLADRGTVVAWDVCGYNKELGLADFFEALLVGEIPDADVRAVDTQTYYRAIQMGPQKLPEMRQVSPEESTLGSPT